MANHYIHVGSITNAMRGRRILESQGIRAYMYRSPYPADNEGCGYRLLITAEPQQAVKLLRENGVRVMRISDAM